MYLVRLAILAMSILCALMAATASAASINVGMLRLDYPELLPISRYDLKPENRGFAGGELANKDNQTTGSFLGIEFAVTQSAASPEKAQEELDKMLADGIAIFVILAKSQDLLKLTDHVASRTDNQGMVFNAMEKSTALRDDQCKGNLFHVAPSHAMLADAVAQFTIWKKWPRWFLIHGSNPDDNLLAEAYRRSAKKFGAKIVEERVFEDTGGSRRTDTGHVLVQRQIPVFTQEAAEHDVVIAADESNVFGLYLPFHTWSPRPVLGSGGLRPVAFHASHEAWGATQFQRRFEKIAGRYMQEDDYNVWLAVRVIGEAVIRTKSEDPMVLRDYILSDAFELAAFKGQKVTVRDWNGQLRQPIILTDSKLTISVSPQVGFLHQHSTLDTLGLDRPESACEAFIK